MKLVKGWKQIVKKAYSMRMIYLTTLIAIAEMCLIFIPAWRDFIPQGVFALAIAICQTLAGVGRVIEQKGVTDE